MTEALQHTISGIVLERAEVYGQIEHTQGNLRQLVIDLDHVDAAIHNFDPPIELGEIKNPPGPAPRTRRLDWRSRRSYKSPRMAVFDPTRPPTLKRQIRAATRAVRRVLFMVVYALPALVVWLSPWRFVMIGVPGRIGHLAVG